MTEDQTVRRWLDHLAPLNVTAKKMFGCWCLYCDGQAVGWLHDGVLSLREVGLDYLPANIKRPAQGDSIRELVIPPEYMGADWLVRAVRDTAERRKNDG